MRWAWSHGTLSGGILVSNGKGYCCSSKSVCVSPAAVRLGHGPHPRHCLAVLLSPEKVQNTCLRLSSCTRSSFLYGRHLRVEHEIMKRSPGYAAVHLLQNHIFFVGALLLFTPFNVLQVPNRLWGAEYSRIQCSIVQEVQLVQKYSSIVKHRTVQYSSTVVQ